MGVIVVYEAGGGRKCHAATGFKLALIRHSIPYIYRAKHLPYRLSWEFPGTLRKYRNNIRTIGTLDLGSDIFILCAGIMAKLNLTS